MVVFLTGEKQTGKSTAIRIFLNSHQDLSIGGYFTVHDTDEIIMKPAADSDCRGFVVGIKKTGGFRDVFESEGLGILLSSENADLIIMDEIGWMESDAYNFAGGIKSVISSKKNVLGVLRKDLHTDLADFIRKKAVLIDVNEDNRDSIPAMLDDLWQRG